jgi:hypothetical protein
VGPVTAEVEAAVVGILDLELGPVTAEVEARAVQEPLAAMAVLAGLVMEALLATLQALLGILALRGIPEQHLLG